MLRVAFVLRSTEVMPVFCVLSIAIKATGCLQIACSCPSPAAMGVVLVAPRAEATGCLQVFSMIHFRGISGGGGGGAC